MTASIKLDGRISREIAPEDLKFSGSGLAILKLGIATNERIKNKESGEYEDTPPTFWNCTLFGPTAENAANTLSKGEAVIAYGRVKREEFTKRDGTDGFDFPVIVDEIGPNLRWAKPKGESSSSYQGSPPF